MILLAQSQICHIIFGKKIITMGFSFPRCIMGIVPLTLLGHGLNGLKGIAHKVAHVQVMWRCTGQKTVPTLIPWRYKHALLARWMMKLAPLYLWPSWASRAMTLQQGQERRQSLYTCKGTRREQFLCSFKCKGCCYAQPLLRRVGRWQRRFLARPPSQSRVLSTLRSFEGRGHKELL